MTKKNTNEKKGKQPDFKVRAGVFQFAGWFNKNRINLSLTTGHRKYGGDWQNVTTKFTNAQFENLFKVLVKGAKEIENHTEESLRLDNVSVEELIDKLEAQEVAQ